MSRYTPEFISDRSMLLVAVLLLISPHLHQLVDVVDADLVCEGLSLRSRLHVDLGGRLLERVRFPQSSLALVDERNVSLEQVCPLYLVKHVQFLSV